MKKAIRIIYIILIVILIKLILTFTINEIYISKYEKGIYKEGLVKVLSLINFPESYIAHYNYGNYHYQNRKYADAIDEYNKALDSNPPKGKECRIRINKALCILKAVDLENKSAEDNIEILYRAREVLCEQGCANTDNPNGHNEDAEQLKKEIDKLIEKLKEQKGKPDEEKDEKDQKEDKDEKEKDDKKEKEKEEELKKREKESKQEREESLESAGQLDGDWSYSGYGKKNW